MKMGEWETYFVINTKVNSQVWDLYKSSNQDVQEGPGVTADLPPHLQQHLDCRHGGKAVALFELDLATRYSISSKIIINELMASLDREVTITLSSSSPFHRTLLCDRPNTLVENKGCLAISVSQRPEEDYHKSKDYVCLGGCCQQRSGSLLMAPLLSL
ncbi:PREDICTED: eukaryotic translation initiation factor 3 subunit C-like [Condylura cristata]|uniref:eukaryotic translation initiation factor 3 subunit C-like n=1 Tax=Condylura cristata TaxID=143302 RepID=UPI000642A5AE|nr:PREDICTED: eukaryotic translation initiation factor 3 subunit C-like [Condylura cristata]